MGVPQTEERVVPDVEVVVAVALVNRIFQHAVAAETIAIHKALVVVVFERPAVARILGDIAGENDPANT